MVKGRGEENLMPAPPVPKPRSMAGEAGAESVNEEAQPRSLSAPNATEAATENSGNHEPEARVDPALLSALPKICLVPPVPAPAPGSLAPTVGLSRLPDLCPEVS